jgi:hypothetical protein
MRYGLPIPAEVWERYETEMKVIGCRPDGILQLLPGRRRYLQELGLPLDGIGELLDAPAIDATVPLRRQRAQLVEGSRSREGAELAMTWVLSRAALRTK